MLKRMIGHTNLVERSLVLVEAHCRMHAIQTKFTALEALLSHAAHCTAKGVRNTSDPKHDVFICR